MKQDRIGAIESLKLVLQVEPENTRASLALENIEAGISVEEKK